MIKILKDNQPIRPIINSIQISSYKHARFFGRDLSELTELPYTFSTKNSRQLAQELATIHVNKN
jgi:hypothetical protein